MEHKRPGNTRQAAQEAVEDTPVDHQERGAPERQHGIRGVAGPKEDICQICETGDELLLCEGRCHQVFHLACLGLTKVPKKKFICNECRSGTHTCFTCKKSGGDVKKCLLPLCGKFYHICCVQKYSPTLIEERGFCCPRHLCISCHSVNPTNPASSKNHLMRCVRCPEAYHASDNCLPAGSKILTPNSVICPSHFTPKPGCEDHKLVNVKWCFVCSKGRKLLCCKTCPASFHARCLDINTPRGQWYCYNCRAGKKPLYSEIVWVKVGWQRWWPAEISHPQDVPPDVNNMEHNIGEFVVLLFGSRHFVWTNQGRVFPYEEQSIGSRELFCRGTGDTYREALWEAAIRFAELKAQKELRQLQEVQKKEKPVPYQRIKRNHPFGRAQIFTVHESELPECNCKATDENPCGVGSNCLNRLLFCECHPAVCPAKERCQNQCFVKCQYAEVEVFLTLDRGWGVRAKTDIKKGEFVSEYVGELIDVEECRARILQAQAKGVTNFYMLTLDKSRVIDAGPMGNPSRFMNHCCSPNCEMQKWSVNGDTRVGLFALYDIEAGTELTFNYNLQIIGSGRTICKCGAPNCSGFLGTKEKTISKHSQH